MRARLVSAAVAVGVAAVLAVVPAAQALIIPPASPSDPSGYLDWPALLAPLPTPYADATERDCIDGAASCIDRTIAEMQRRLNTVVPVCDHRAVFSLAYLRVTEDVRDSVHSGLFSDTKWLQNEDRVFARMYFNAYDDYAAGRLDRVPESWRLTFDAAEHRQVPALANFLMSMNAHINRDFPYMLAGIGLTRPDGTSHKADHDRYNRRLAALYEPVLREVAARFDPTTDDIEFGPLDNEGAFAVLQGWREGVWRNAELLANARTATERRLVAAEIESYSTLVGRSLLELFRYRGGDTSAARDAWCASHGGQDPSFGTAAPKAGRAVVRNPSRLRVGRGGTVRVLLACPVATTGCRGRVVVERRARRLGTQRFRLRSGQERAVIVRLSPRAAARARRGGSLRARVVA